MKRRAQHGERGAVFVETAAVAGIVLTFLLFSVDVGLLGFLQVTADAAAFVGAHSVTVASPGPTANAGSIVNGVFPQVKPGDVVVVPQPAPTATVPVNYGFNDPNPQIAASSQYSRNGGFSMLQPTLLQTIVWPSNILKLPAPFRNAVTAADTEAMWTECGAHFNVSNENAGCGGSAQANYAVNYFSAGENTPPYYVGFNDMQQCVQLQPWGQPGDNVVGNTGQVGVCPASAGNIAFQGLGVAEYLDTDNWSRPTPGMSGSALLSTFGEAACHQRVYSALASFFSSMTNLVGDPAHAGSSIYQVYGQSMYNQLTNPFARVYDYQSWTGFGSDVPGLAADRNIQQVYSWDHNVPPNNQKVGTAKLTPANGCIP